MNTESRRDFIFQAPIRTATAIGFLETLIFGCTEKIEPYIHEQVGLDGKKITLILPYGKEHPEKGGSFSLALPDGFFNRSSRALVWIYHKHPQIPLVTLGVGINGGMLELTGTLDIPDHTPSRWEAYCATSDLQNFTGPNTYKVEWDMTEEVKRKWNENEIPFSNNIPQPTKSSAS